MIPRRIKLAFKGSFGLTVKVGATFLLVTCLIYHQRPTAWPQGTNIRDVKDVRASMPANLQQPKQTSPQNTTQPRALADYQSDQPTIVLLMAYMRGGSSFFGSTFSMNEDVFYFYEPVWDVYNSMLASHTMLFPARALLTSSGDLRELPSFEREYVINSLVRMFKCDFNELRVEAVSGVWTLDKENWSGYVKCLKSHKIWATMGVSCQRELQRRCPLMVDDALKIGCHKFLDAAHGQTIVFNTTEDEQMVNRYKACIKPIQGNVTQCLPLRTTACKSRSIRAAKVLRLRMRYVEDIIKRMPNVKVIHQLRDPRGTLLSRQANGRLSFGRLITREAEVLCSRMAADIRERRILEAKYPGVFLEMKYEDLATMPDVVLQRMYSHIGRKVPGEVSNVLHGDSEKKGSSFAGFSDTSFGTRRKNSSSTAYAWKGNLELSVQQSIDAACQDLFQLTGYQ